MAPINLKAAERDAYKKATRKEKERMVEEFMREYNGDNRSSSLSFTGWAGIIIFGLIIVMACVFSVIYIKPDIVPNGVQIVATPTYVVPQTATPRIVTATPTNIVATPYTEATVVPPTVTISAVDLPIAEPMTFGGVFNPVRINSELFVPEFNGTLSPVPQRIMCGNGKTNVSFDYQPAGVWTQLYVVTTADPHALFVRMPSPMGGPVTIYCPPAITTYLYIYVK